MRDIKTESDLYKYFFKNWLVQRGYKEIMRVEHARLPDVRAVNVKRQRVEEFELKIGKVFGYSYDLGVTVVRYKVSFRPGQMSYANGINSVVGTPIVSLVVYDPEQDVLTVCGYDSEQRIVESSYYTDRVAKR